MVRRFIATTQAAVIHWILGANW